MKSVIGNGRTIVRSAGGDNGSTATTANPARKSQVRDAVTQAESDIEKVVTKVADSIKTALSGGQDDDNDGEREAQVSPPSQHSPGVGRVLRMRAVGEGGNGDGSAMIRASLLRQALAFAR